MSASVKGPRQSEDAVGDFVLVRLYLTTFI